MFTLNCKGKLLVGDRPLIMGIINVTPDSFYEGSRFVHPAEARQEVINIAAILNKVGQMIKDGADIIDIGAQSTRPHAQLLSDEEELFRLTDTVEELMRHFPDTLFSIDTFHSRVAAECIAAGASIINDISGGNMDKDMMATAGRLNVPYVCMHMRGTPQNMNQFAVYENITAEIMDYFILKVEQCRLAGIKDMIIDPGFGFSKNKEQNFELLKNFKAFKALDKPLLAGLSRKSTIYKTLGVTAEQALNGTTVMNTVALMNGANILRVHDVREAQECITLFQELQASGKDDYPVY